ncbi:TonB-dependent receptor [Aquimarina gracilis]
MDERKKIGSQNVINVTMKEDTETLEEVVVTGYSAQKRSDITGSVVKVDAEKLEQVIVSSVDQALQGNVSGVSVSAISGTPGSTSNIRIRGISSITAGNEPLYVIDGVPVNNGNASSSDNYSRISTLAALDQNNIESITVLKDASATAQYGARGSNGVIVITTKKGKQGKTKFSVNMSYGFQNDAVEGAVPLTAANRLELYSEALFNDGRYPTKESAERALLEGPYKEWNEAGRPEAHWDEAVRNKDAVVQQLGISASGGGEDHTFFGSLGYFNQEATVIGVGFERISGSLNLTKDLTPKIKFSSNNSGTYSLQNAFLERSAFFESPRSAKFFLSPLLLPYNEDGSFNQFGGSLPNPLYLVQHNIANQNIMRIISNNSLNWQLTENLSFGSTFNVDYQGYNFRLYSNRNYGYSVPNSGDAAQFSRSNVFYVFQNYFDYRLEFSEAHRMDFKVLQEYQSNRSYFLGGAGENFAADGLFFLDNVGTPTSVNSSFFDWYVGSYLGLLKYSAFDRKYILDLSYRREGNSRFPSKSRWGQFWSVGGAWNIFREDLIADIEEIDNLRLRASYGVTGNANIELNQYQALFGYSIDYGGEGAQSLSTFGNDNLTWETSHTFDIGVDFGFFDNFFSGSIGYFKRTSSDLLLDVPLSQTTGFASQVQNIGELTNTGIEVDFNFNIVNTNNWKLNLGGNFSTVNNEVTKLPVDNNGKEREITTTTTNIATGHPVREWFMPTWAGVNPETGNEEWFVNGVDGETTTVFNEAEAVFQGGNAVPTFTAGLNLNFSYKGFFINAQGYYAGGHKIYEGWHRYLNQPNGYTITTFNGYTSLLDRWQKPGDVARNGKFTTAFEPWERHSKFLFDGDFFRLRALTLGYDMPSELMDDIGMGSVRIYVRGNNLLTWVKDENLVFDPEVDLNGETGLETPPVKTVAFGVNITF